jgi:hypothetical protein
MASRPGKDEMARVTEDAEDGLHGRLDDPGSRPELGPIERGPVDAGPTGEREGGYRQAESGFRIAVIGGAILIIMAVVLYFLLR